jgi:hypothetical protein
MLAPATIRPQTRRHAKADPTADAQIDLPMLVQRHLAHGEANAPKTYDVFIGRRLRAMSPIQIEARLSAQELFISRLGAPRNLPPGWRRAVEVRYLIEPATKRNGWTERVQCVVLGRVTGWGRSRQDVRRRAAPYLRTICDLLTTELPGCDFEPLAPDEVAAALEPFKPADLVSIRHIAPDGLVAPESSTLSLPLLGVPDPSAVIEVLLRQSAPSTLLFCVEPLAASARGEGDLQAFTESGSGAAPSFAHLAGDAAGGGHHFPEVRELAHASLCLDYQEAIRLAPHLLRVEAACAEALGEAAINTLTREVGGPSRAMQGMAWRQLTLPLANTATPLHPRSSAAHAGAGRISESAIAFRNLRTLDFAPWGAPATWSPAMVYQADLGEVARCLALPGDAAWLPAHSVALRLAFRAGVDDGLRLGVNDVRDIPRPVYLPLNSRRHHTWIVGETGTGKTTLIENLVLQDAFAGRPVILIDPHGDLIHSILKRIPRAREGDVILFDPADKAFPVGLNPLDVADEDAQAQVVSSFIELLIKLYDPHQTGIIGPRYEYNVRNVMYTVMSTPGSTLVEVLRALQDDQYVFKTLLPNVTDPLVRRYWEDEIRNTSSFHRSEVINWLASKFGRFVTDRTMRSILGQSKSSFSFREAMDDGKIVLISLAKGLLGSANANFLGLILLPMILQAALSRADQSELQRRDVGLYIDEFQNYATDSLAQMLAEARKYHLSLLLANQHIGQLAPEIRDAVVGNVGSMIAFRLGVADAMAMEAMLAPSPIHAADLSTLPDYHAYARLLIAGQRCPAFTLHTERVPYPADDMREDTLRALSRARYGRPRAEVQEEINRRSNMQ